MTEDNKEFNRSREITMSGEKIIETNVSYPKACKIVVFISMSFWLLFISWAYSDVALLDYRNTILYLGGVIVGLWFLLHFLRPTVCIKENEVRWQSFLFPFVYRRTNLSNIKRVKMVSKYNPDWGYFDVMIFYGEKYRLFSVGMGDVNAGKLYAVVASHYGTRIQDQRKKSLRKKRGGI